MEKFDAIIVGAGLTGLAAALGLGSSKLKMPLPIALIDRADPRLFSRKAHDSRCSALTRATQNMLSYLGVWESLAPKAQAMQKVIVTNSTDAAARSPLLKFDSEGAGAPASFVENQDLFAALLEAVTTSPNIMLIPSVEIAAASFGPGLAEIILKDGRALKAPLTVGADGRNSFMRETAGIAFEGHDYPQSAITLTIEHEKPHEGIAKEHFHPHGVLAVLPLTGNRSSIVWTNNHDKARSIHALSDHEFVNCLNQEMNFNLGEIKLLSPRHVYPLSMRLAPEMIAPRLALVGDAAHALHPLAGLGLNLGFKDVAALADCVFDSANLGGDLGSQEVLQKYEQWRRFDTYATSAMLDGMNTLFANDNAGLSTLRKAGLQAIEKMPPVKTLLMDEAAGVAGPLPRLMRGLSA